MINPNINILDDPSFQNYGIKSNKVNILDDLSELQDQV